ncbi:hypothetical protein VSDG_00411 [Cytospora chrysosperma]|uniref:Uncharacterized protein n=1 Tax=Cytospora chrysosperma TaxID=252740 RepID=A0A423WP45_CYTCH|nr:hypothetical protein VSDG_00411 [Valsa sordida]
MQNPSTVFTVLHLSATPDVANVRMATESFFQHLSQELPHGSDISKEVPLLDCPLDSDYRCTANRVTLIGNGVYSPATLFESVDYILVNEQPSNWLIASTQALADRLDVWNHTLLLPGMAFDICPSVVSTIILPASSTIGVFKKVEAQ